MEPSKDDQEFDFLDGLDTEKLKAVEELRAIMETSEGQVPDDSTICRYLRARNWDVALSSEMLMSTLKWRKDFQPHAISAADIEIEARPGKMYDSKCFDVEGRPIIYMKPGLDPNTSPREVKVKYLVWTLEKAIARMDTARTGVEKMTWIIDYRGCGLSLAGPSNTRTSLDTLNILQNHYPERLGLAFMVFPPWAFWAFWKVVSPFVDEVTKKKVIFVNSEKEFPLLQEHIKADQLEEMYGGSSSVQYNHSEWLVEHGLTDM